MDGRSRLQKALYVYNMNVYKPRTKDATRVRLEKEVVDACRQVVRDHDMWEYHKQVVMDANMKPAVF